MKFLNLKAEVPDEPVLKRLNCIPGSELYEEFQEELSEIREEIEAHLQPQGAFAFGTLPKELAAEEIPEGSQVVCAILTIGSGISDYCTEFFNEGDCVKGMLADTYADTYLFELEKCWVKQLEAACREKGVGISRRLEIPEDLPMEAQKFSYETIGPEELPGVMLTSGYMFVPVKSICHVFLLSRETQEFHTGHNCRRCSNVSCNMRSVQPVRVGVRTGADRREVICRDESRLLEAFTEAGIAVSAVCGGRGTCGKCRVRLRSGEIEPSSQDKAFFSEEELKKGWRLACHAYPLTDCEVELPGEEQEFQVLTAGGPESAEKAETNGLRKAEQESYGIAVDIGTTTLAAQLTGMSDGGVIDTEVSVNHQRSFGADVLSRIQASNEGKKRELQESIQKDLKELFRLLLKKSGVPGRKVSKICLAGNTTMEHLLMGYSCEELGRLPFRPVTLTPPAGTAGEIFEIEEPEETDESGRREYEILPQTRTELLPGISAFVGADIAAGLLSCGFDREEGISLLLDLGTNGEMALGGKEKLYVTSTAAGPAFEGGCISWGCGSVPGAICHVRIDENHQAQTETIGGKPPAGLCGTGLIETAAELLRAGLMDETGRLEPEYAKEGFPLARTASGETIVLTQKDIRELQLAKAAVRAGMEILLKTAGIGYQDVHHVWLAGGFGYFIDWSKAAAIGLLPEEFLDRIQIAGNSSLAGTRMFLTEKGAAERLEKLRKAACEVSLGGSKEFQEAYMDAMFFE